MQAYGIVYLEKKDSGPQGYLSIEGTNLRFVKGKNQNAGIRLMLIFWLLNKLFSSLAQEKELLSLPLSSISEVNYQPPYEERRVLMFGEIHIVADGKLYRFAFTGDKPTEPYIAFCEALKERIHR